MLASCSKIDFDPTTATIRYLLTGDKRTATVTATNHLQCLEISKKERKIIEKTEND